MRIRVSCAVGLIAAVASIVSVGTQEAPAVRDRAIYGHVSHVGWVVRDLEAVLGAWRRLGVSTIGEAREIELATIYRGTPVTSRLKLAVTRLPNAEIQWIQPLSGENAFTAFLESHGDGIHHLAFRAPSEAALDAELASLAAAGVPVVQSGSWDTPSGKARFAYLDTAPEGGGITFELEYDPHPRAGGAGPLSEEPFGPVTQYAILVKDARKVSGFYERLGFGPIGLDRNVSLDRMYRGRPGAFEMWLGFTRWSDVVFEWIEPIVGPSVYDEHLERHGEGFHHLGFNVTDMDAAIAALQSRGAQVTMSGGWPQGRFAYFDTERHGGVALELLWNKPREN